MCMNTMYIQLVVQDIYKMYNISTVVVRFCFGHIHSVHYYIPVGCGTAKSYLGVKNFTMSHKTPATQNNNLSAFDASYM